MTRVKTQKKENCYDSHQKEHKYNMLVLYNIDKLLEY
jgi:hypothetical protein